MVWLLEREGPALERVAVHCAGELATGWRDGSADKFESKQRDLVSWSRARGARCAALSRAFHK